MKKVTLLLFLIISAIVNGKAQTIYPCGVSGCIARWTFDTTEVSMLDTLPDMSGNNNPGSVTDIASVSGFRNKLGAAGGFNGTSSFAEVVNNASLNPSQLTIITLVRFNGFYQGTCQGNNIIYNGYDYTGSCNWALYVVDNTPCNSYGFNSERPIFQTTNIPSASLTPNGNYIDSNKWYFIATTYNGSDVNYFLCPMDTNFKYPSLSANFNYTLASSIGNSNYNLFIGATQNPPFPYYLNGSIDELVLFNKALSVNEIYSVYSYLWGTPTMTSSITQSNNIQMSISNNYLDIKCNKVIKKTKFIDITGRTITELFGKENKINISYFEAMPFIVQIEFEDKSYYSKLLIKK
jgi:hypothetical protein